MNIIEKYEYIRSISDEQFEFIKQLYKDGKYELIKTVSKIIRICIAGLVGYISYDSFGYNELLLGWLTAVSTVLLLFPKKIKGLIWATLATKNQLKGLDSDQASDRLEQLKAMARGLEDFEHDLYKRKLSEYDTEER